MSTFKGSKNNLKRKLRLDSTAEEHKGRRRSEGDEAQDMHEDEDDGVDHHSAADGDNNKAEEDNSDEKHQDGVNE